MPLASLEEFQSDRRNIGAAESCLRRALKARLDLGRHVLAKAFGEAVSEYRKTAEELEGLQVVRPAAAHRLRLLAGYRNRMVNFYHDVTAEELYAICPRDLMDVPAVKDSFLEWLNNQPAYLAPLCRRIILPGELSNAVTFCKNIIMFNGAQSCTNYGI